MLKIGDFSNLAHVTVKTLRHYADLNLLKPVWIDRFNGYRYYALDQLPRLNRILALKEMGFSLEQIRELLDEEMTPDRLRLLFNEKQSELQHRLAAEQNRLERVAERLLQIEQEGRLPDYEVTLKSVPAQPVASLRSSVSITSELRQECQSMRMMIDAWLQHNGLRDRGPWLTIYHSPDYSERNLDVEVACMLPEPASASLQRKTRLVHLGMLPPAETMASVLCPASPVIQQATPAAYTLLYSWTERAGYTLCGPAREIELQDRSTDPSPTCFMEIQIPVKSTLIHKQILMTNPYRKEEEMEPKFINLPDFTIVGVRYFGKNENQEISQLWGEGNKVFGQIKNVNEDAAYGVCTTVEGAAPGEFEYVAGLRVSQVEDIPSGMVVRQVPALKYAVFTHVGSLAKLRETYNYIYQTWLPKSGYKPAGGIDFEYYNADFKDFSPDSRFYIYVPIE